MKKKITMEVFFGVFQMSYDIILRLLEAAAVKFLYKVFHKHGQYYSTALKKLLTKKFEKKKNTRSVD